MTLEQELLTLSPHHSGSYTTKLFARALAALLERTNPDAPKEGVSFPEIKTQFTFGEYIYHLVIKSDYCGASYTCTRYLPGEDWLRGGDLRDGRPQDLPAVLEDILEHVTKTGKWTGRS